MGAILAAMVGGVSGSVTNSFNITAAVMGGGAGYSDGSAGTSTGVAVGSITGGTLTGGKIICEVSTFSGLSQDRFRVRGFSGDPGVNWLVSVTVNSVTKTSANLTYSWDAAHSTANWIWATGHGLDWGITSPNTYNGNSIKHNL